MGALPKRKISRSKRGSRRSHLALAVPNVVRCPQCRSPKVSHQVCHVCGMYNGMQVLKIGKGKSKERPS